MLPVGRKLQLAVTAFRPAFLYGSTNFEARHTFSGDIATAKYRPPCPLNSLPTAGGFLVAQNYGWPLAMKQ